MSGFLFPEYDDEARVEKLRERWRYEAMARLPVFTKNYHRYGPVWRIYRVDQLCRFCSFCGLRDIKIILGRKKNA